MTDVSKNLGYLAEILFTFFGVLFLCQVSSLIKFGIYAYFIFFMFAISGTTWFLLWIRSHEKRNRSFKPDFIFLLMFYFFVFFTFCGISGYNFGKNAFSNLVLFFNSNLYYVVSVIICLCVVLLFLNRKYFISEGKTVLVLFVSGLSLIFTVFFSAKLYSVEWAFLVFIVIAVMFYFFKVDSRFLILPALFLLWYCPFLLSYKLNVIAERLAVFVYYFLVVGVILQLFEKDLKLEVEWLKKYAYSKLMLVFGVVILIVYLSCQFYFTSVNVFYKASLIYFSTCFLICYFSKFLFEE